MTFNACIKTICDVYQILVTRYQKKVNTTSVHLIRKKFPSFQIMYCPPTRKILSQEKSCLPNWFTIFYFLIEEMTSPKTFVRGWNLWACKTPDVFFWLIFHVSSPPSATTLRFQHFSSINPLSLQWHLYQYL